MGGSKVIAGWGKKCKFICFVFFHFLFSFFFAFFPHLFVFSLHLFALHFFEIPIYIPPLPLGLDHRALTKELAVNPAPMGRCHASCPQHRKAKTAGGGGGADK